MDTIRTTLCGLSIFVLSAAAANGQPPGAEPRPAPPDQVAEPRVEVAEPEADEPGGTESKEAEPKTGEATATATKSEAKQPEIDPRKIRVHLMDGSNVTGELGVDRIEVETEFGTLTVPVERVLSITPGLDSHEELSARIDELIDHLGSPKHAVRDAAKKELLKMGQSVRTILQDHLQDENAERRRQVAEIVESLEEQSDDEFDFFDDDSEKEVKWRRYDTVVTPKFTIAGQINPSEFELKSKYGMLTVTLDDIKRTERRDGDSEPIEKTVAVAAANLMHRTPKSTGVRVSAGQTITVAAAGQLSMTPWGSNKVSGPEGSPRYSYHTVNGQKLYGGTLIARVGDNGKWVRVGKRARFKADKAGVLKFAIAMKQTYARPNYQFPGGYKVRVKVDPED